MDKYQRESMSAIADWLATESWNYFITLRPLKTMLKEHTIENHMNNIFSIDWISKLFYVLEMDRDRESRHAHIILKTERELTRQTFGAAIKRHPTKEVKYFEKVRDAGGAATYCSKHIGNEYFVKGYNMLTKESVFNKQFELNFNNPNKEKQLQQKIHNQLQYRKGFTGNSFLK
tara:strand:- start:1451 stop:1972 length:522 start_codon:yes stop_codon:yes gene_type:complete